MSSWVLYLCYFALTLCLEFPFFLLGFKDKPVGDRLGFWVLANGVSYPAVFFLTGLIPLGAMGQVLVAEVWAPLSECLFGRFLFRSWSRRETLVIVAANLTSWQLGDCLIWVMW